MSKYTTEVRFICETYAGYDESQGFSNVDDILEKSYSKVFDFDFPIFDEAYRSVLCRKILMHYYTREISEETVGLWKLRLCAKMREIMPYYNQMYESALLEFNPLYDTKVTTTNKGTRKNESDGTFVGEGTAIGNGTQRRLYSDTPQGSLRNVDNETYLTNATKTMDSTNDSTTSSSKSNTKANTIDDYITVVEGKTGGKDYSELVMNFRKTFLNIDMDIIDELSSLFFGLW